MNSEHELINSLMSSQLFKNYQQAFTEATGLPLTLRAAETWQLPLHGQRHENPWCALMAGSSPTCSACLQMQERLTESAGKQATTMTCTYGLSETVVPIVLGEKTIGYLQTGQVMLKQPGDQAFNRALQQTTERGVHFDTQTARNAFFHTPVLPRRKMHSLRDLLGEFAEHLALKSNQIMVQREHAEPPQILRAKEFIDQHLDEAPTLNTVASAVHMSVFYFCKLFKKATGLTFTGFVNRRRIEKARNLLLNHNLRISEIAYESGFQSLTHFNRTFRKIMGESPTAYRRRLRIR